MGDLSAHFSRSEFACHHCHQLTHPPPQSLLSRLEQARVLHGGPITIVSGYRCPIHNRAIHGAINSRHLYGDAADLPLRTITTQQAKSLGFRGIGYSGPWAVHVDMRPGTPVVFADP